MCALLHHPADKRGPLLKTTSGRFSGHKPGYFQICLAIIECYFKTGTIDMGYLPDLWRQIMAFHPFAGVLLLMGDVTTVSAKRNNHHKYRFFRTL